MLMIEELETVVAPSAAGWAGVAVGVAIVLISCTS